MDYSLLSGFLIILIYAYFGDSLGVIKIIIIIKKNYIYWKNNNDN